MDIFGQMTDGEAVQMVEIAGGGLTAPDHELGRCRAGSAAERAWRAAGPRV